MRKLIFTLLSVVLMGCNDQRSTTTTSSGVNGQDTISSEMPPPGNIQEERDAVQTERAEPVQPEIAAKLDGRYRKMVDGKAAADCNCDCIEIDFEKPTEWCIDKDKLYITAQTRKSGEHTADVFFISASREIEPDRALPWDSFDTNSPIAKLVFKPEGGVELDWLGFSTNGEIATDYALYGKKTLEGTYKKD